MKFSIPVDALNAIAVIAANVETEAEFKKELYNKFPNSAKIEKSRYGGGPVYLISDEERTVTNPFEEKVSDNVLAEA